MSSSGDRMWKARARDILGVIFRMSINFLLIRQFLEIAYDLATDRTQMSCHGEELFVCTFVQAYCLGH